MAFPSPNPMIICCKKCGWSYKQKSDVLEVFGNCPQCGNEELELSFVKGDSFKISTSKSMDATTLLNKVKKFFKL